MDNEKLQQLAEFDLEDDEFKFPNARPAFEIPRGPKSPISKTSIQTDRHRLRKFVRPDPRNNRRPAWFPGILAGFSIACLVLCANVTVLIWVRTRFETTNGIAVLFTGSCTKASSITAYAELAINVVSTLLLATSCNCSQLLVSPTRKDVDEAHFQGDWVHVGSASLRNFRWISRWRICLWVFLFGSSVPLHLLYNSVIYSSSYTADFITALVSESFETGARWNETHAFDAFAINSQAYGDVRKDDASAHNPLKVLSGLQSSVLDLAKLENGECEDLFGTRNLNLPYLNVLLVTNYTSESPFINGSIHRPERGMGDIPWFNATGKHLPPDYNTNMDMYNAAPQLGPNVYAQSDPPPSYTYSHGSNWSLPVFTCTNSNCTTEPAWVQYCLAQPVGDPQLKCTVSISTNILVVVIICNCAKAICFLVTLASDFHPLATVGDAIESFLNRTDPITQNWGPISMFDVIQKSTHREVFPAIGGYPTISKLKSFLMSSPTPIPNLDAFKDSFRTWEHRSRRWGSILSSLFPFVALLFCGIVCVMVFCISIRTWSEGCSWSHRETLSGSHSLFPNGILQPLTTNALLINTPQLAISIAYIFYTTMLTKMSVSNENSNFATQHQSLRVSHPRGSQKPTYQLQLPYQYILPLMIIAAIIHWFLSRGVYLTNVRVYNIAGEEIPHRVRFTYDTSGLPLLFAFLLCIILAFVFVIFTCRKLGGGMPIIGTCSLAISAACHPVVGDEDAARGLLMYGAMKAEGERVWHVCFCSEREVPLSDGEVYC